MTPCVLETVKFVLGTLAESVVIMILSELVVCSENGDRWPHI